MRWICFTTWFDDFFKPSHAKMIQNALGCFVGEDRDFLEKLALKSTWKKSYTLN